jgi:integrase/recombinase XerD
MFRWLEVEEIIDVNPFHKLKVEIKIPRRLPRNVSKSDMRLMLEQARVTLDTNGQFTADWLNLKPYELNSKRDLNYLTTLLSVELLVCTGIRVCELSRIKLGDIFLNEKKIKVLGKGSRERYVYLPTKEVCALTELYVQMRLQAEPTDDSLLVNSRGQIASTQFIRKLIKNIARQAKTRLPVTPHMLRHSAACELLESGLDMRFVQRLLGHSSISTTEIYTHVADTVLQERIEKADVRSRIMKK